MTELCGMWVIAQQDSDLKRPWPAPQIDCQLCPRVPGLSVVSSGLDVWTRSARKSVDWGQDSRCGLESHLPLQLGRPSSLASGSDRMALWPPRRLHVGAPSLSPRGRAWGMPHWLHFSGETGLIQMEGVIIKVETRVPGVQQWRQCSRRRKGG